MRTSFVVSMIAAAAMIALPVFAVENGDDDDDDDRRTSSSIQKIIERIEKIDLPDVESPKEHPQDLFIRPQGRVVIHSGEVTVVTDPTITVKVWGLSLQVNIDQARFIPEATTTRSSLKVGDKVNIDGTISRDTGQVSAKRVHVLTQRQRMVDELIRKINDLIARLRELQLRAGLPQTPLQSATTTP